MGCRRTRPSRAGRQPDRGNTLTTVKSWPDLKAVIYFDSDCDFTWWTDTSSSSIAAYRDVANNPWFKGKRRPAAAAAATGR